jgi:outer membrane protein OmpA-like peptidoglycan-associated protein
MSRLRAALLLLLLLPVARPAQAQITGHPYEVSAHAGWFNYDTRSRLQNGPAFGGSAGYRLQSWLVGEATVEFGPAKTDTAPHANRNFSYAGADLRWNLRPAESRIVPFVLTGVGIGQSHQQGLDLEKLQRGTGSLGVGALLFPWVQRQRTAIRVQVRDIFFRERDVVEFSNQFASTIGIHWIFGGKPKDTDLDGVRDWLDSCPGTPIGATVDTKGCPIDSDRDSVYDGIDQCPNTPVGCKVDKKGCPLDADGDGVCDGFDTCPDTPKGATVDSHGCPVDSDRDSVYDGIDQCPNTPIGAVVDERGCPKDGDGDGVPDGLDKCPNTPAGWQVDATGCVAEVIQRETELLDTGMIRLRNVNFATGKADLLPDSYASLDVAGGVLAKWPELKIEIGGHTDSRGSAKANQKLSEARAKSVRTYLLGKYPTLKSSQLTAKGYGSSRPIVPNNSEANMAKNRRVEFVVLNKDVLKREVERRRAIPKEGIMAPGGAPLDSLPQPVPAKPDSM